MQGSGYMLKNILNPKRITILLLIIVFLMSSGSVVLAGLISTEQEIELGEEAARQLEAEYGLYNDPYMNSWVTQVGTKLVYVDSREGITYRFKVLDMEEPNALAIPGGFVYVTRGIMTDFVRNDEDYLAVIVGHELGHVNKRHGMKQLEWSLGIGLVLEILLGQNSTAGDLAELAAGLVFLKYSRGQESEADEYGMKIAYEAGYDPRALIRFFRDLQTYEEQNSSYSPEFLQSHPDTEKRIEEAEIYAAELTGNPYNPDLYNNPDDYNYYEPTPYYDYTPDYNSQADLTGTWEASFSSPIILEQSGKNVTGTYQNGGGYIEGVINGSRLDYEWIDAKGSEHGTGYFDISSDGNTLEGKWYSSDGDGGDWKAWRGSSSNNDNYDNYDNYDNNNYYNISGKWKSSLGDISLNQSEDSVEGYFGGGKGRIKGNISGKRFDYEWFESVDNEGGTGYFIISEDGNSMSGQWYSETGATGNWTATR